MHHLLLLYLSFGTCKWPVLSDDMGGISLTESVSESQCCKKEIVSSLLEAAR